MLLGEHILSLSLPSSSSAAAACLIPRGGGHRRDARRGGCQPNRGSHDHVPAGTQLHAAHAPRHRSGDAALPAAVRDQCGEYSALSVSVVRVVLPRGCQILSVRAGVSRWRHLSHLRLSSALLQQSFSLLTHSLDDMLDDDDDMIFWIYSNTFLVVMILSVVVVAITCC